MNLGKQIYILLKKEIAVYVDGLGVFRRIHTPSVFDDKKNVFLPPITFVEFDAESTEGYDLVHYLQQIGPSSKQEASDQLERAVTSIKEQIAATGQATLDNLGHLVGYGKGYVFKPIDLSGFNLGPIASVTDQEVEEKEVVTPEEENIAMVAPEEIRESPIEVIVDEEAETEVTEEYPSNNRSFVYGLVAAIAVLALGGLYYYSQYYAVLPQRTVDHTTQPEDIIVPVDTTEVLRDTLVDDIDTAQMELVETPIDTARVEHKYTIIIGTHRTLAQAYEEAEAFNKDGHKSVRVLTPNLAKNLKRVIWDTYETKEERDSALRYVQKHVKTDAWPSVLR